MEMRGPEDVTGDWLGKGKEPALADWVAALYGELRRLAHHYLQDERSNHTLQPTALVHEAYLRLLEQREIRWESRGHVMAMAAQLMRRILLDYSRNHHAAKRGGKAQRIDLDDLAVAVEERSEELLALDAALTRFAGVDPQPARVVELRFFGGLSIEETAEILDISPATVKRNWNMAKAWLARELRGG